MANNGAGTVLPSPLLIEILYRLPPWIIITSFRGKVWYTHMPCERNYKMINRASYFFFARQKVEFIEPCLEEQEREINMTSGLTSEDHGSWGILILARIPVRHWRTDTFIVKIGGKQLGGQILVSRIPHICEHKMWEHPPEMKNAFRAQQLAFKKVLLREENKKRDEKKRSLSKIT